MTFGGGRLKEGLNFKIDRETWYGREKQSVTLGTLGRVN